MLKSKDILGLREMPAEEIDEILDVGMSMKKLLKQNIKKLPHLQGKSVTTLFYENSTRTRCSFELAAKYMGAHVVNISADSSSVKKGETLVDTGKTLDAMKNDIIVIRHPMGGAPALLGKTVKAHVVNAGDGMNEHPSQALLDMLTMRENFGSIEGLKVAILGDISHSRVAKSNLFGLKKLGAEVTMYAPKTLIPTGIERMGAKICRSREEAVEGADVVMGLRIQLERQHAGNFPSLGEYSKFYGVSEALMKYAKPNALVMHPGPVNRGVELTSGLIDGETSRIEEQVLSGIAVRMAMLFLLTKEEI
ncbi:MAG TPA: aspartate carbamoyltransferase catalytic subunit [Candidatus Gallimonas intestinavium]|uniref:Aspartate carbamoyltransferase n=1 Tax=Candidatus Gallimonas intestinavium TaxID=2838603 RepID=A0A9D2G5J3_9FIRM|nr:aspartate carbamoyltransferase catalytic subunit [Candidatus Gallimonas intestinavium]